jgi:uncharacterized linocin/CFP29 family protein
MNDLKRELAPVTDRAWCEIEAEARNVLRTHLGGRKAIDMGDPLGWEASSIGTGRTTFLDGAPDGVELRVRHVQPLIELCAPFTLNRVELDTVDRGARDVNLTPVTEAARRLALMEDRLIFYGGEAADIRGIASAPGRETVSLGESYESFPDVTARSLQILRESNVEGPYALVLGPAAFQGLSRARSGGGYPIISHVRRLIDGPTIWTAALDGAVLLSLRGGDFELVLGRDVSVGYRHHSWDEVELYLQESMTFRLLRPEAAVPILPLES